MQLRFETGLTSEEYVSARAWQQATLPGCPIHPRGGCSFRRHGTYERVHPPGTRIARWYCRQGHCTVSLLPDCLPARLPGTMAELESAVVIAEHATSLEAAANAARSDEVGLVGALRWVGRRRRAVHANLRTLKGLLPEQLACAPTLSDVRRHLATEPALERLRSLGAAHLHTLAAPLGFSPPSPRGGELKAPAQQRRGPDPPRAAR